MIVAVIGTGNVGAALGQRWAQAGHRIIYGSREPQSARVQELVRQSGRQASAAHDVDAARAADVILLATPWHVSVDLARSLGDLGGKVLIDATNPIGPNWTLAVGYTTSAAEQIAAAAPSARVVKAFNSTGSANMLDPNYGGEPLSLFLCGDDADAKATVTALAASIGFEVVDSGALVAARLLEPLALLWIGLAYGQGLGPNIGFRLLRR